MANMAPTTGIKNSSHDGHKSISQLKSSRSVSTKQKMRPKKPKAYQRGQFPPCNLKLGRSLSPSPSHPDHDHNYTMLNEEQLERDSSMEAADKETGTGFVSTTTVIHTGNTNAMSLAKTFLEVTEMEPVEYQHWRHWDSRHAFYGHEYKMKQVKQTTTPLLSESLRPQYEARLNSIIEDMVARIAALEPKPVDQQKRSKPTSKSKLKRSVK